MFVEASRPNRPNTNARLRSPTYPATSGQCLSFWSNMFGSDIGSLKVYASKFNNLGTFIWNMYGDQGQGWRKAQVTVASQSPFQVSKLLLVTIKSLIFVAFNLCYFHNFLVEHEFNTLQNNANLYFVKSYC